jgi:pyrroline-5-carboxylate reductase
MLSQHIALIGAGTMGQTIATGLVRAGIVPAERLTVLDHDTNKTTALARDLGVRMASSAAEACKQSDVILLCVKPKDVSGVIQTLRDAGALHADTVVISIAAGVATASVERDAGIALPVVRAMPNTPSLVGQGMTGVCKGTHATDAHVAIAREMFTTLGRCLTLEEKHMDVVTGLSGSGPAFVYVMLEALADGGVMCGLPRATATDLVAQVALGAATMILSTGRHPSALKDDVTTPGGCTIAGLLALEDGKIRSVLARAVETATETAAGLGAPSATIGG